MHHRRAVEKAANLGAKLLEVGRGHVGINGGVVVVLFDNPEAVFVFLLGLDVLENEDSFREGSVPSETNLVLAESVFLAA